MTTNLLELLIVVSEKAANIARICRQDQNLFTLLVQEKDSDETNSRFLRDFKTLADVLIQETVRHDISEHYPALGESIQGEENNVFTNLLGETVEITVCSHEKETAKLLEKILNGNVVAADVLAAEVHKKVSISSVTTDKSFPTDFPIDIESLGVWIDPIDSTFEYIDAQEFMDSSGIYSSGLRCVTVLIGAYCKKSGLSLMGVVNQPFHQQTASGWQGKCYWGVAAAGVTSASVEESKIQRKIATLSRVEEESVRSKLEKSGFELVKAAGAGYKLLTVITGLADVYIVSQGTTYRWDVCGPQAILRALGGGVYEYAKLLAGEVVEVNYVDDESQETKMKKCCNKNGLVAVRDKELLNHIMELLKQ